MDDIWIVSSHFNEDLDWLRDSEFRTVVVSKRPEALDPRGFGAVHHVPNKGREFGSYLWFICNHWDALPDGVAFIHGHERSYHQSMGTFKAIERFRGEPFHGLNGDRHCAYHYFFEGQVHPFFGPGPGSEWAWTRLGLDRVCHRPSQLVFQPGTQTIVSREIIRCRPLAFYQRMLDTLMGQADEGYHFSLLIEAAWHVALDQPPIDRRILRQDFHDHCMEHREPVLITGPNMVWGSRMPGIADFSDPGSEEEWARNCLKLMKMRHPAN